MHFTIKSSSKEIFCGCIIMIICVCFFFLCMIQIWYMIYTLSATWKKYIRLSIVPNDLYRTYQYKCVNFQDGDLTKKNCITRLMNVLPHNFYYNIWRTVIKNTRKLVRSRIFSTSNTGLHFFQVRFVYQSLQYKWSSVQPLGIFGLFFSFLWPVRHQSYVYFTITYATLINQTCKKPSSCLM